ncbi:histone deacetylase [Nocardioides sp. JQ2195]|uniref:histone deacetylase n=1 Tax=Nocardioides sp. JQ2195 TaxID=2592334 RepID=UPI00143E3E40|nr:histone deacetylase [Nocardioides sp. JQ2195]QIX27703.1 histone deacetylase [Nocardioides sp. JQ2195]
MSEEEVWYVSYGSNMSRVRLACYIQGGRPPGAAVTYAGAHDRTIPAEDTPVVLPGSLYFAGDSRIWGGGTAFYDHDRPGPTPARAYRMTVGQFVDVAAQEMHRLPDPEDPLAGVVVAGLPDGRHEAGPGVYETLIEVGRRDDLPMLTFTAPHGLESVPHTRPQPAYLAMLAEGLHDAHGWSHEEIESYFTSVIAGTP